MFVDFFLGLRQAKVPVTLREYLTLLDGLKAGVTGFSVDEFYYLSRAALVKDERNYDKFDRAFGEYFKGIEAIGEDLFADIPDEWLRRARSRKSSRRKNAPSWKSSAGDKLMQTLKERLAEQQGRHQGGSKWIGTGGTSPFWWPMATTRKAFASARTRDAGAARSRSGTSANTRTSTTRW